MGYWEAAIRGELGRSIATSVPGTSIASGLPRLAKVIDRASIVRSMTHPYPIHGVAYALTGTPRIDIPMELNPRDPAHWRFHSAAQSSAHLLRQQWVSAPHTRRRRKL